jgi:hypothetical protein
MSEASKTKKISAKAIIEELTAQLVGANLIGQPELALNNILKAVFNDAGAVEISDLDALEALTREEDRTYKGYVKNTLGTRLIDRAMSEFHQGKTITFNGAAAYMDNLLVNNPGLNRRVNPSKTIRTDSTVTITFGG